MEAQTAEREFAANMVQYVMRRRYNDWNPDVRFPESISPFFTPVVQNTVSYILNKKCVDIYTMFAESYASIPLDDDHFIEVVIRLRADILPGILEARRFILFSCFVSQFAVLAYERGAENAPDTAVVAIYTTVQISRNSGNFTGLFWLYIQEESARIYPNQASLEW